MEGGGGDFYTSFPFRFSVTRKGLALTTQSQPWMGPHSGWQAPRVDRKDFRR